MSQDKATIQEAAKALHVDRKTIYRWIEKGLLSKVKEGNKTLVIMEEVKAICDKGISQDVTKLEADSVTNTNIVTLDRPHYEGLLIKLGQFEAERRYLLEYKTGLQAKDKELSEIKERLIEAEQRAKELEAEVNRLRKPFWKKIFSKY